jgi:hypothetical protein
MIALSSALLSELASFLDNGTTAPVPLYTLNHTFPLWALTETWWLLSRWRVMRLSPAYHRTTRRKPGSAAG